MDKLSIKEKLRESLTSSPKYIPVWYRWDEKGSQLYEEVLKHNDCLYFDKEETETLKHNLKDIVAQVDSKCVLIEMGCGSGIKTSMVIDELVQRQGYLKYVPVDISGDMLKKTCERLDQKFRGKLQIIPIEGDYDKGVEHLPQIVEKRLIILLGVIPYHNRSIQLFSKIAEKMKDGDIFMFTVDINQNKNEVINAYDDKTDVIRDEAMKPPFWLCLAMFFKKGYQSMCYINAITRLNREMESNIDVDKFELQVSFDKVDTLESVRTVRVGLRSMTPQSYAIPGLGITIHFEKDEILNLFSGDGLSYKYTPESAYALIESVEMKAVKNFVSTGKRILICCCERRGTAVSGQQNE